MKVTISVGGKFHAFALARELYSRGVLDRLITTHPKFNVDRYGIPRTLIRSHWPVEVFARLYRKLPSFVRGLWNPQYFITEAHDRWTALELPPSNIFHGWASFSLHSMRKAKRNGAITILERSSSHIQYQNDLLKEEYERYGLKSHLAHPRVIEKELREYAEADYISVPSIFVKRSFLERGFSEKKLLHAPFGADLTRFSKRMKKDNVFRVIFVGGMSVRKGVHYLLQAFAELNLKNAELLLIGVKNDEIEPFFRRYSGTFKYIGPVQNTALAEYYSQASVFVMMSLEEGLAMVQLEAMACGLPVICTTNTGGEDVIRDGVDGYVIPVRDTESLKAKLFYLYEHEEERQSMGESGLNRVRDGFTWQDYGDRVMKNYGKLLGSDLGMVGKNK